MRLCKLRRRKVCRRKTLPISWPGPGRCRRLMNKSGSPRPLCRWRFSASWLLQVWKNRLGGCTNVRPRAQELAARLEVARQEMHELAHFDYLVVNHSNRLDDTVHTIKMILEAEKRRVHPRRIRLAELPGSSL